MLFGTGDPVAGGRKGGVCLDSVWRHDSFDRATAFVALLVVFAFDSNNRIAPMKHRSEVVQTL
jgi:hypothetical protein